MKLILVTALLLTAFVQEKDTIDKVLPVSEFCQQNHHPKPGQVLTLEFAQQLVRECGAIPPPNHKGKKPCAKDVCEQGRPPANGCFCE